MADASTTSSITVDKETAELVRQFRKETHRTVSGAIRAAVEDALRREKERKA